MPWQNEGLARYVGFRNGLFSLVAEAFTLQNFGATTMTSTTITAATPNGYLEGMVACMVRTGPNAGLIQRKVSAAAGGDVLSIPMGLFARDALHANYENQSGVASEMLAIIEGISYCAVRVYETRNEVNAANLVYAIDAPVYASQNGLLSCDTALGVAGEPVLGYVKRLPTASDPRVLVKILL